MRASATELASAGAGGRSTSWLANGPRGGTSRYAVAGAAAAASASLISLKNRLLIYSVSPRVSHLCHRPLGGPSFVLRGASWVISLTGVVVKRPDMATK